MSLAAGVPVSHRYGDSRDRTAALQDRQSCSEFSLELEMSQALITQATLEARTPVKISRAGRVAALASHFQTSIAENEMKGPTRKFSTLSERIQAYNKATTEPASSPSASQRPIAVRAAPIGTAATRTASPQRASPEPGRFGGRGGGKLPLAASKSLQTSRSKPSSLDGSPKPLRREDRSKSMSSRPQATTTTSKVVPSPQTVQKVDRQVSDPVLIRTTKLVHSVSPIIRSSPTVHSSPMATPPLPKSSPPALPTTSPPTPSIIRVTTTSQNTPPLPKAPIPSYSPSTKATLDSPLEARRKPSNLTMSRHISQPGHSTSMQSSFGILRKTKSTSDSDDAGCCTSRSDIVTDLMPISRSSSSAKSPMTRDSGCESSGSTNASPEFSPPSSSVSSDSVFPSVKDEQITKVERPIVLDTASGSIELQQLLAERDHLQLVLKDAERTLYAVEKERDGVINKSRQQHQDHIKIQEEYAECRSTWSAVRQQATSCVHDAHGFFVGQDAAPVWYTTMVEILDNALVALDGKLPNGVVSKTCSNGVRESLQKQLESLSKQLEETRRERRSLQERSVAMEKEKRQLQNEVVLAQHSQSSTRLESGDLLSRKEQQLQEMKSKYQLLEHERERECKQVKTLSSRNAVLEKNMEEAREKLAEAEEKLADATRCHNGELAILRNSLRDLKREKAAMEDFFKKDVESRRERHNMELRCRDSQIQQMEEETEMLTMQVQNLEEKLTTPQDDKDCTDGPEDGKQSVTDLTIKVNRLAQDLATAKTRNKELEAMVEKLKAATVASITPSPPSSLSVKEPSPAPGRKFSPATVVRGTIVTKATGPASSPSSGQVQRTVAPPSSLSTSSPRVTVRTHTGTKPSAPGNRHTFSEFSTSTRAKSDSEAVRTTSSSANASPHNYSKFGRYSSFSSSSAITPGSPAAPYRSGQGSSSSSANNSPHINQWSVMQRNVQATGQIQITSKRSMLLEWCRQKLNSYRGVEIQNFHRSWRNGLAFCALLHYFDPSLLDFDSLSAADMAGNLKLAFDTAETVGITSLLDVCDMVDLEQPEWHSVMTYVSSIYNHFNPKKQ